MTQARRTTVYIVNVDNIPLETAPTGSPLAPILSTLTALVVAMENTTTPSPAATAYSRAIRRKADELVQAGGPEALAHAVAFIREQAPAKADQRQAIITETWTGLAGFRP